MKVALSFLLVAALTACSSKVTDTDRTSGSELGFSMDFFRRALIESPVNKNVTVSPYSAGVALSMLMEGAEGETRAEIYKALNGCSFISAELSDNESVIVNSANSVWLDDDFPVKKNYVDHLAKDYGALATTLDFSDRESVRTMNSWCSEHTEGMIEGIIDELTPDMVMVLMNALYFNAPWMTPFDPAATYYDVFNGSDGRSTVPYMSGKFTCDYVGYDGNQLVRLPYKGGRYSMFVLLPSEEQGVDGVLPYMTEKGFSEVLSYMKPQSIRLSVPKFRTEHEMSLVKTLQALGIRSAFTASADLSGIANGPLCVSDVLQKAVVDVDEKGAEAAAVTAVIVKMTSVRVDTTPIMKVDRPFYYMIADVDAGRILFAGRVMNL